MEKQKKTMNSLEKSAKKYGKTKKNEFLRKKCEKWKKQKKTSIVKTLGFANTFSIF